jgi:hypothetical protein
LDTVNGVDTPASDPLFSGDLMKATLTTSSTSTRASVQDLTAGHKFMFTRSGTGAASFRESVGDGAVQSSGKQLPVVNFGTIPFSAGAVGGKPLGSVTPKTAENMQTSTKVLQVLTGALTGTTKNAFTTTWKHS